MLKCDSVFNNLFVIEKIERQDKTRLRLKCVREIIHPLLPL